LLRGASAPLIIFPPSFGKGRGSGGWISKEGIKGVKSKSLSISLFQREKLNPKEE
jgi:hypothetical protein